MTALDEYARLETAGVWRATPEARGRNVTVTFGDASLVMTDQAGTVISHWSLAAIERVNPNTEPAILAPSAEAGETLEIADADMIRAIERVRASVAQRRPRHGALRRWIFLSCAATALVGLVIWLPGALVRHTVSVAPEPVRAEVGGQVFRAITRLTGSPCRSVRGDRALALLHNRLAAPAKGGLLVLPSGFEGAISLPGGLILLNRSLVEDHETPDVAAGYILGERARADIQDPLERLLAEAGLRETIRLLTTGHISGEVLQAYGERLITRTPSDLPAKDLLDAFAERKVASTPYAYARDVSGESTLELIEADPMRSGGTEKILSDADWVALQGICGE